MNLDPQHYIRMTNTKPIWSYFVDLLWYKQAPICIQLSMETLLGAAYKFTAGSKSERKKRVL